MRASTQGGRNSGLALGSSVPGEDSVLDAALTLAELGIPPIRCIPGAKADTIKHGNGYPSTDPEEVRRIFAGGPWNLGAKLPPGMVGLDIDVPKDDDDEPLPGAEAHADRIAADLEADHPELRDAWKLRTRSGGLLFVLKLPDSETLPSKVRALAWVDLRGDGRTYVLVPPSAVGGREYAWLRAPEAAPPTMSSGLLERLRAASAPSSNGEPIEPVGTVGVDGDRVIEGDPEAYARAILERTGARLAGTAKGGRHQATLDEARTLGRWVAGYEQAGLSGLTVDQTRDVLEQATDANGYRGEDPRGCDGTIRDALRYGMARPFRVTVLPRGPRAQVARSAAPVADPSTDGKAAAPLATAGGFNLSDMTPELARALASFNYTDLGNGERFALLHGDVVRYCDTLGWLVWDGRRWVLDRGRHVRRLAARTARAMIAAAAHLDDRGDTKALTDYALRTEKGRGLQYMLENAAGGQEVRSITVDADDFDTDPDLFNAWNGTVDLRTGELRAPDPADLITKVSSVKYHMNADAPLWRAFQERITAGDAELLAYKQRALGYTLTGHTREQVVLIAYGNGANGKSTELEAVADVAGDYARAASFDTFATNRDEKSRRFGLAPLAGARFVRAIEGDIGTKLAEGTIKLVTGGEKVPAEYKGRDGFEYTPRFKLWLASNHKPQTRGTDHGLWRRLRLVPYTVTIPEDDRDLALPEKLRAELPGILAWLVQGARDWYRDGLGSATAVSAATDEYRSEMDSLAGFFAEAAELERGGVEGSARLHAAYRAWCASNGERHMSIKAFAQALQERGLDKSRTKSGVTWHGVRLSQLGERLANRELERDGGRF